MDNSNDNFLAHYQQFKDKIYNYFLYRVGFDVSLAEDLTSEVFLKAFQHFADFDPTKRFQPWIYMIAHNHLVNYYRTSKRVVSLEVVENIWQYADKQAENKYELERVLKIINAMEDTDREILRLKFVDQLDNEEIAEVLGKEAGAMRTQLSRSLSKLRERLTDSVKPKL